MSVPLTDKSEELPASREFVSLDGFTLCDFVKITTEVRDACGEKPRDKHFVRSQMRNVVVQRLRLKDSGLPPWQKFNR